MTCTKVIPEERRQRVTDEFDVTDLSLLNDPCVIDPCPSPHSASGTCDGQLPTRLTKDLSYDVSSAHHMLNLERWVY